MNRVTEMLEDLHADLVKNKYHSTADKLLPIIEEAKKGQTLTDFVDTTIVKLRSDMCDNYCKYTKECNEAMDQGEDFCCPLDRL